MDEPLSELQLSHLESAFRAGAADASTALAKWLSVPSLITIESVEQRAIVDAISNSGEPETIVCVCVMAMTGSLTGHVILIFDEGSGLSLADLLLNQQPGTSAEWGDVEQSAALETHNIIGCAYLNSLARHLSPMSSQELELIPSPPEFRRDFVESILETVFLDQASAGDIVFDARACFEMRGQPLYWTLLFIPDAQSVDYLRTALPDVERFNAGDTK